MIQFLIAILLGLACSSGNTKGHGDSPKNNSEYSTLNGDQFDDTGGENGQIPPPPRP